MNRRDWLALFLALEGAPDGLDPVRIQKGMFLFAMQGEIDPAERYPFKPYDYGPMSTGVYVDLERLAREGLLVRSPVVGKRWSRFSATDAGLEAGHRLVRQARDDGRLTAVHTLHRLKDRKSVV